MDGGAIACVVIGVIVSLDVLLPVMAGISFLASPFLCAPIGAETASILFHGGRVPNITKEMNLTFQEALELNLTSEGTNFGNQTEIFEITEMQDVFTYSMRRFEDGGDPWYFFFGPQALFLGFAWLECAFAVLCIPVAALLFVKGLRGSIPNLGQQDREDGFGPCGFGPCDSIVLVVSFLFSIIIWFMLWWRVPFAMKTAGVFSFGVILMLLSLPGFLLIYLFGVMLRHLGEFLKRTYSNMQELLIKVRKARFHSRDLSTGAEKAEGDDDDDVSTTEEIPISTTEEIPMEV